MRTTAPRRAATPDTGARATAEVLATGATKALAPLRARAAMIRCMICFFSARGGQIRILCLSMAAAMRALAARARCEFGSNKVRKYLELQSDAGRALGHKQWKDSSQLWMLADGSGVCPSTTNLIGPLRSAETAFYGTLRTSQHAQARFTGRAAPGLPPRPRGPGTDEGIASDRRRGEEKDEETTFIQPKRLYLGLVDVLGRRRLRVVAKQLVDVVDGAKHARDALVDVRRLDVHDAAAARRGRAAGLLDDPRTILANLNSILEETLRPHAPAEGGSDGGEAPKTDA